MTRIDLRYLSSGGRRYDDKDPFLQQGKMNAASTIIIRCPVFIQSPTVMCSAYRLAVAISRSTTCTFHI